tara:strand:- start:1 stop:150 length:150 start_codon:yes stop_codon:yes gene_type:complete
MVFIAREGIHQLITDALYYYLKTTLPKSKKEQILRPSSVLSLSLADITN